MNKTIPKNNKIKTKIYKTTNIQKHKNTKKLCTKQYHKNKI